MSDTAPVSTPAPETAPQPAIEAAPPPAATPEPPAAPPAPKADPLAPKFAELTKRDRAIREREQALKAAEKELEEYRKAQQSKHEDPIAFLRANGLTYADVTNFVLNQKKPTPDLKVAAMEERLSKLQQELEAKEAERNRREAEATIATCKAELRELITDNSEKYRVLRAAHPNPHELLFEMIDQHFQQTGEILQYEDAAEQANTYFVNQAKSLAEAMGYVPAPTQTQSTSAPAPSNPPKTLTNSHQTQVASKATSEMTPEERLEAAKAMLRWKE